MLVKMIKERERYMDDLKCETKEKCSGLDNKLDAINPKKESSNDDFDSFIKNAKVILVDNAFEFDINEWEKKKNKKKLKK